ncbi:MAG: hypothetical protein PHR35_03795 [Kiritimatiellae bacterium]|nr:hypothetical protein [Kiritimatiellia bacterium]
MEWTLIGKNGEENMGAVRHPGLSSLRFGPGEAWRLSFSVKGSGDNTVIRNQSVAAPLCVRIIYREENPTGKPAYRYDWHSFYPDSTEQIGRVVMIPPDAGRWPLAGVTFFFLQAGTYVLDDVTLELWP